MVKINRTMAAALLALETDKRYVNLRTIGIKILVHAKTGDNSAEWCSE